MNGIRVEMSLSVKKSIFGKYSGIGGYLKPLNVAMIGIFCVFRAFLQVAQMTISLIFVKSWK